MPKYHRYKNKSGGYWRGMDRNGKFYTKKELNYTKNGCFIATAAYGSYNDESVLVLHKFKDEKLLSSNIGKTVVSIYYKISPPIANLIAANNM